MLYYIASILYYISFITLGLQIFITLIEDNEGFESRDAIGYSLPVGINLRIPDSTIVYKNNNQIKVISSKKFSAKNEEQIKAIVNNPAYEKTIFKNQIKFENKDNQNINSEFGHVIVQSAGLTGNLYINPKDTTFRILLELKTYLLFLLSAFAFWHIAQFFKILSNNFSFSPKLKQKLYIIAGILLGYQIITFIINIASRYYIDKAAIISSISGIGGEKEIVLFHPIYEVNWIVLLISLSIICIAKLLDHGYQIQNENDLTI